jgi:hypothetical protein
MNSSLTREISYIDGLKSDSKGEYYVVLLKDERGNIKGTEKEYTESVEQPTLIFSLQSESKGHLYKIAKKNVYRVCCGSPTCSLCRKSYEEGSLIDTNGDPVIVNYQ